MSKRKERVIGGLKSVFSKTKEEFKSSGGEFRSEFKDFLLSAQSTAKTVAKKAGAARRKAPPLSDHLNYNVGGKVLAHFQEEWSEMHERTTENSVLATSLDRKLQELTKSCKERHKMVETFHRQFQGLKGMLKNIERAKQSIEDIGTAIDKVEQSLKDLEYNCALLDSTRKKGVMRVRYESTIQEKEEEATKMQRKIDTERTAIEQQEEVIKIGASRERQQAFGDIFNQQVTEYKSKGHVERPINLESDSSDIERSLELADVEIEDTDGTQSLNEFLGDVTLGKDEGNLYGAHKPGNRPLSDSEPVSPSNEAVENP